MLFCNVTLPLPSRGKDSHFLLFESELALVALLKPAGHSGSDATRVPRGAGTEEVLQLPLAPLECLLSRHSPWGAPSQNPAAMQGEGQPVEGPCGGAEDISPIQPLSHPS